MAAKEEAHAVAGAPASGEARGTATGASEPPASLTGTGFGADVEDGGTNTVGASARSGFAPHEASIAARIKTPATAFIS